MKKVGIMSMQRIANYGSFLQAFALKTMIEELGNKVEFVDYHVEDPVIEDDSEASNKSVRKIKKGAEVFKYRASLCQKIKFIRYKQKFNKNYMPLLGVTDTPNYNPQLDVLVIGSDEVFNCIQKNANVGYSLELFGKNHRAKKIITYAPSFGNTTIEKLHQYGKLDEIGSYLKTFNAFSARDKNTADIIKTLTEKEVEYHLDPVLTYDYMNKCSKIPRIKKNESYIIVYAYSGRISEEESKWIREYAKNKSLKVYAIGGIQSCADEFIDCSPFEVLAYFQNADEIITDTFHGSIFSIITEKKFTTLVRKSVGNSYGNEEKLTDLLERLGLGNRITIDIRDVEKINNMEIHYDEVVETLTDYRNKAKRYLKEQL